MRLPYSWFSANLLRFFLLVGIAAGGWPALAQQTPATNLPDDVRGAKIYQLPEKGGRPAPNPTVYKRLSFADINFHRLLLDLFVSIDPVDRSATVQRMYFQDVNVNGIPVQIDTFAREFKLSNKKPVDLPGPLKCSIVFSDLDSLKPVRQMVDQDNILITGQSFIEIKLNPIEKLALRAKRIVIRVALHETVPLNLFQGDPLLRTTADKVLDTLADPSSVPAINVSQEHLAKLRVEQALGAKLGSALYLLDTEYVVRDPKSQAMEKFSQYGTGFMVSADGKLLTTKRIVMPWKFDPQVAFLLQSRHLEVDTSSVRTFAWPASSKVMGGDGQPDFSSALSTEKQTLKLLGTRPDQTLAQDFEDADSGEHARLDLHKEGDADLALLQVTGANLQPLAIQKPGANASGAIHLVLGSYPFGLNQPQAKPRLLGVTLTPQAETLAMDHPVDPGESGAPLLDTDGNVVALAASGTTCISMQAARSLLP